MLATNIRLVVTAMAAIVIALWMNAPSGTSDVGPWFEAARRSALARTGQGVSADLANSVAVDDDEEALRAYNAKLEEGDPARQWARLTSGERANACRLDPLPIGQVPGGSPPGTSTPFHSPYIDSKQPKQHFQGP